MTEKCKYCGEAIQAGDLCIDCLFSEFEYTEPENPCNICAFCALGDCNLPETVAWPCD